MRTHLSNWTFELCVAVSRAVNPDVVSPFHKLSAADDLSPFHEIAHAPTAATINFSFADVDTDGVRTAPQEGLA